MIDSDVLNSRTPRSGPKAPFTILIVEDNATDVELMLHALESADLKPLGGDFEMEVRAKAEGALQLLGERAVDLVLTDMCCREWTVGSRQPHSKDRSKLAGAGGDADECGLSGCGCDAARRL